MTRAARRGTFRPPVESSYIHKTADESNSTLVLADVAGMSFPVAAGGIYIAEFHLLYTSAVGTTGCVLAVNGPASPTYLMVDEMAAVGSVAMLNVSVTAFESILPNTGTQATSFAIPCKLNVYLVNGVNAGTVQLRFRSEVDTSAVTIKRGSFARITRVA